MAPTGLLTCSAGCRAKGSSSHGPIAVRSGEVPIVDTPLWGPHAPAPSVGLAGVGWHQGRA